MKNMGLSDQIGADQTKTVRGQPYLVCLLVTVTIGLKKYKFFQFLSIVNFNILASNKTQPIKNQIDEQTNLGLI